MHFVCVHDVGVILIVILLAHFSMLTVERGAGVELAVFRRRTCTGKGKAMFVVCVDGGAGARGGRQKTIRVLAARALSPAVASVLEHTRRH